MAGGGWSAPAVALAAALAGLAATALAGYQFGIGDQAQYLVQVIDIEEPEALAGDPYLGVFAGLRSWFWPAVAAVSTEASRPGVLLGVALAASAANALLATWLGVSLLGAGGADMGGRRWLPVAAVAVPLTMVVTKEANWFGLVSLTDVEVTATSAVMPLVFGAMLLWVRGRWLAALVCAVVAMPIHGQVGAFLLAAWWTATLLGGRGRWRVPALVVTGVLGATALGLEAARDMAAIDPARHAMLGRRVFAELVDPLSASLRAWASVGSVLLLGIAAGQPWTRTGPDDPRRRLLIWGVASCALPVVGMLLLALPGSLPVVPKLMVGRALMLPQIVALVWTGTWAARTVAAGSGRAVAGVVVLVAVAAWPFGAVPTEVAAAAVVALSVVILATTWVWPLPAEHVPRWEIASAAAVGVLVVVAGLAVHAFVNRPFPWLARGEASDWQEAQAWAREHTSPGTVFLTPPYQGNWRVGSHRPTFGELKDGGLSFYTPERLEDWGRRMTLLRMTWAPDALTGGRYTLDDQRRAYRRAVRDDLPAILKAADVAYVVTETGFDVDMGEAVWRNDRYVIRHLRSER